MNYRNMIKCYLSILVAFSLIPQPKVLAQSNSTACEAELYKLSNVQLADTLKLTSSDVLDTDVEQIGNNRQQTLPTNSPYKPSATKDVAKYWQMRVNKLDPSINASDVKYTLIPSNQVNNPFKQDQVQLRVFDSIDQIEECGDETIIIAGGISLEFRELSKLKPGIFQGQIEVCVQVNGNQCQ